MSKDEFIDFLIAIGGLIYARPSRPTAPIYQNICECDEGWYELIAELIRELIQAGWTREIRQIKEKFGGLRFYASGLTENCADLIIIYEARSFTICEICGSGNNVRLCGTRWVKTLCDQCAPSWLQRQYLIKLRCVHKSS